jgi:hypothetical protein
MGSISFVKYMKIMSEQIFQHLNVVFNISYYIGKNNKSFSDIPGLCEQ